MVIFMKKLFRITKQKVAIALIALFMLGSTSTAFAYWYQSIDQADPVDGIVKIDQGGTSTVTFSAISVEGGSLVPSDVDSDRNTAIVSFDVEWNEDKENTAIGTSELSVTVSGISMDNVTSTEIEEMFNVEITKGQGAEIIMNGDSVEVEVKVIFENAPKNKEIYDRVKNKDLTVEISIEVDEDPN